MNDQARLFRQEAVEFSRSRLGTPAQNFGISSWLVVGLLISIFATAAGFACTARYARKETVLGIVTPGAGVERIAALRPGVIKQVLVADGQAVHTGQPLMVVSFDPVLESGAILSNRIEESSRSQIESVRMQGDIKRRQAAESQVEIQSKMDGLVKQVAQLNAQHGLQVQRVALLQKDVDAAGPLVEKQFISQLQFRQKQDALLQSQQNLLQVEENISQDESEILDLKSQQKSAVLAVAQAKAELALSEAQHDEKRTSDLSARGVQIVAEKNGTVTNLQVHAGDVIAANQSLGLVVPDAGVHQQVSLWVPSRAIGFVRPGDKVRLMFDAFPYQTFGVGTGKVVGISNAPMMPADLPLPIETKEQMYKITVGLENDELLAYGQKWALIPGMRLTADLITDERSLLDWVLDPLLAVKSRWA